MNYAVKIMLTQYNNKYYDLEDPYWIVGVKSIKTETEKKPTKKGHTSVSSVKEDASSSK